MKWSGQHIYDLISRFRDSVYLEDLSTTTETNVLVVDSDGKVSKSTTLADDIIESEIDTLAGLIAIGTASNTLDVTNDTVRFNSVNANDPLVIIKNTTDDEFGGRLRFLNARGADGQDDDEAGKIEFYSYDDGTPSGEEYAAIKATIHDATAGEESGRLQLQVASHDGGSEDGLVLTGGSVDAEVDVTIGNGAASVTTVAGSLRPVGQIQMTSYNYKADQGTTKTYVSLADADSEGTVTTAVKMPFTSPVAGKLLKVFLKSNKNLNSHTLTWRLETQAAGVTFSTGPTIVGTQSGAGCTNSSLTTYDFTSSLDSGDNLIDAGDTVFLSLQSDTDFGSNVIYYITCLWEWDFSGI